MGNLADYNVTIILGLIEREDDSFYNTAAVISRGKLLGSYRKVHLFEENFQPGIVYPVFEVDGLTFGINICYDARFPEGAKEIAAKGARVIFYPLNNRLAKKKAVEYHGKHLPNLVERAHDTGCWIVSSDIIAQDSEFIAYGFTAIVDPNGNVIKRAPELRESMEIVLIP
jgi:predicted amidohydrolase